MRKNCPFHVLSSYKRRPEKQKGEPAGTLLIRLSLEANRVSMFRLVAHVTYHFHVTALPFPILNRFGLTTRQIHNDAFRQDLLFARSLCMFIK